MKLLKRKIEILNVSFVDISNRSNILAASSRNLTKLLVHGRNSSNIWSYGINIKNQGDNTGDMLIQFKGNNGGAGDVYMYYDVPIRVYRRFISAPSLGHFFWVNIRNNYLYSKLTGDKRGKLPNAIN